MSENIEISDLDLRYEGFRMRSKGAERELFVSILTHGIRDPLRGVQTDDGSRILLDGFKRYRCAKKQDIRIVPFVSLGSDEVSGILELLRIANAKSLSILEQARLVDELKTVYKMTVSEIAELLEKSKGWVGMRAGLIKEMSPKIMERIFNGEFPVYSYMYAVRPFIRMNGITKAEADEFIDSVSGKGLSIRDIEILANGYFKGGKDIREQIRNGNILWGLSLLKGPDVQSGSCTEAEQRMLKDLEIAQKYMQRVVCKRKDKRLKSPSFFAQTNLLTGGILRQINTFKVAIEELYDRSGQKDCNILPS